MHAKIGATNSGDIHSFSLFISSGPGALPFLSDLIKLSTPLVLISILVICLVGIFGSLDGGVKTL